MSRNCNENMFCNAQFHADYLSFTKDEIRLQITDGNEWFSFEYRYELELKIMRDLTRNFKTKIYLMKLLH